jgi:hypothetical protein
MKGYDEWILNERKHRLVDSEWEINIAIYMEYLNLQGYIIPVEKLMEGIASSRMAAISADLELM